VSHDRPFAAWPEQVAFDGRELDAILDALHHAIELAPRGGETYRAIRRGQLTIWRKLWPELAEQYDDLASEGEE
jgi:hypothetical protein